MIDSGQMDGPRKQKILHAGVTYVYHYSLRKYPIKVMSSIMQNSPVFYTYISHPLYLIKIASIVQVPDIRYVSAFTNVYTVLVLTSVCKKKVNISARLIEIRCMHAFARTRKVW